MKLKKRLLKKSRLYAILDKGALGKRDIVKTAAKLSRLGVDIVQLRDKISKKEELLKIAFRISKRLSNTKTIFIINDYLDIAKIAGADGVHLGQLDFPISLASSILGRDKIIGISTHSLKQAKEAQKSGADYLSLGPVFKTPSKPEYKPVGTTLLKHCVSEIKKPIFVIGGINEKTIDKVLTKGAKRVAVLRLACQPKNIAKTINKLKDKLK